MKPQNNRLQSRTVFTTLDGKEIHFNPFSWDEYQLSRAGLMEEYRERGEIIDIPQYTVKFVTGATAKYDHDSKSILKAPPDTPAEEVEAVVAEQVRLWEAYQETLKRFNAEDQDMLTEIIYEDSLGDISLPDNTAWEDKQHKRHIRIPEDPEEKRRHYISTVLVKFRSDMIDLVSKITAVSMGIVKEDDLEAVMSSFQHSIWGDGIGKLAERNGAKETENTTDGEVVEQ